MRKLSVIIIVIIISLNYTVHAQCHFVSTDAKEWIENNQDKIKSMTRTEWQKLDEGYKWPVFVAMSPKQKHEFFRLKIEQVRDRFEWNEAEIEHINRLHKFFMDTPELYSEENEEKETVDNKFILSWVQQAMEELKWSLSLIRGIAMEADDLLDKDGNVRVSTENEFLLKELNIKNYEPTVIPKIELNHPCMLHTDEDFLYVIDKVKQKAEPWYMGFKKLESRVNTNYLPRAVIVTDRSQSGFVDPSRDAEAAYQLALMWKLTGDKTYANSAIRILNAWAKVNKSMGNDANEIIVVGYCGYKFANAAEMMRGYLEWRKEDFEIFKLWITGVLYKTCYQYLALHYEEDPMNTWLSWDVPILASALAIGILCDDMEKIDYALNYFYNGAGPACINKAVINMHEDPAGNVKGKHLAQSTESGREMGHAMTTVTMYGYICQMAFNIGIDLFAYNDNIVLDLCEYLAKYNVYPDEEIDMPFTPYYTVKEGWKSIIGQNDPSKRGQRVVGYELIYNHYKCKGANPYYSKEFARTMRPEGEGIDFGTLMYTKKPIEKGEDKAADTKR